MTFDPLFTCPALPKDHCIQVSMKYIKAYGYDDICSNNTYGYTTNKINDHNDIYIKPSNCLTSL